MGCPQTGVLSKTLTFSVTTRNASGGAVDADASPTYRIYEDETGTPIMTGTMSKLDDPSTTGFYAETITLAASSGFEPYKTYTIYVEGLVAGVTIQKSWAFLCLRAEVADDLTTGPVGPADVLAAVNKRLRRRETGVDEELRAALKDITGLGNFLEATESPVLLATEDAVSLPADYKAMRQVSIDGVSLVPMSLAEYLEGTGSGALAGTPEMYCVFKGEVLFDRSPAANVTVRIDYFRYHPGDVSTVLLPDEFREAIYCLTTAKVAEGYDLNAQAQKWLTAFNGEMTVLAPRTKHELARVRYIDI
ncbi:MAG TPA: hypothetical protein VMY87_06240 [Armatimonadota bacterium]|nr:hypothetical protein [Armatimonadota bacterium]